MPVTSGPAGARRARLAWMATLALLGASLVLRIWHRADYFPGWDVLGAAQGLYLVSTRTAGGIFRWYVDNLWNPSLFWNVYGIPSVLLPGALAAVWPWLFWNHAVVFALSLLVLWLTASAFGLGRRDAWIVVLAWTASGTLVSQSVVGLPYLTCTVPYALAVWTVLRLRARPVWTAVLAAVVYLVAWQGQELGRTVFLVFLGAAVMVRAPWPTRGVWLIAGVLQAVESVRHASANTAFFANVSPPAAADVLALLRGVAARLFVEWWIDLPTLVGVGLVCLLLVRRERWLWRSLFVAQVALTVALALKRDVTGVWPRRFLLVDLTALFPVVAVFSEWRGPERARARTALVAVLFAGAVWQLAHTVWFTRQPLPPAGWGFTMPFVHTTVDYQSVLEDADWTRAMLAEVRAGKKLILAYNFSSYGENPTNPGGVPERLYLTLGHRRFHEHVYFFGDGSRWDLLPARPVSEIDAFVAGIDDPDAFVGWYPLHPNDLDESPAAKQRTREVDALLDALKRRFTIVWEPFPHPAPVYQLRRFTLRPRADAG